ncbi:MAG: histidine triad nucleotide-binding protein [Desulfamplus sp.]|nr:histidine triad nucleotide-binding protein [Desulfamplus sp.]MBF0210938.1 histidine triad nucleotide-binding protein [Desulfamplus sp.]
MAEDCLFCKIVNRQIPSEFLYEDENFVVIKDINPHAPVHLLILPKRHIRSINNLETQDSELVGNMFLVAKQMAKEQGVNESGYKVGFNVEKGGGQVIFHLHLHLLGGWEK